MPVGHLNSKIFNGGVVRAYRNKTAAQGIGCRSYSKRIENCLEIQKAEWVCVLLHPKAIQSERKLDFNEAYNSEEDVENSNQYNLKP
jgi:hypothetical protein